MNPTYFVLAGSVLLFGGSAVVALVWAMRKGQFADFQRGATSIFDADEPIGRVTDAFPGQRPRAGDAGGRRHG